MKCKACGGNLNRIGECLICPMLEAQEPPGGQCTGWPIASRAAAVHPDEIPAAMAIDRKAGVRTEYDPRGRPIFTDRGHRKKYLKAHKMRDNDGGYGD